MLPSNNPKKKVLFEHHQYPSDFFTSNEFATVGNATDALSAKFAALKAAKSTVYHHLRQHCHLIIKPMGNPTPLMDFEYASLDERHDQAIVVSCASYYMYQRERFGWNSPASRSPERELENEGGVMFTVFAAFNADSLLKIALKTNLKKGRKSINVYLEFLGGLLDELKAPIAI